MANSNIDRRSFLTIGAGLTSGLIGARSFLFGAEPIKMKIELACGSIGVKANLYESIKYASEYGFEAVGLNVGQLTGLSDSELRKVKDELKKTGLVAGAAGLPVQYREDEGKFQADFKMFRKAAEVLEKAGVERVRTWISPAHRERTYRENFRIHVARLGQIGKLLSDHGIRFGLEYVGPKTSWTRSQYPFIHTMAETKELIAEIGLSNVGFVLDSWHWYTAGESGKHLEGLTNQDVVCVDLNDAPAGLAFDEQMDNRRELPMATGMIDLAVFMNALKRMGFDGPMRAEPFDQELRDQDAETALKRTARAMKKALALVS